MRYLVIVVAWLGVPVMVAAEENPPAKAGGDTRVAVARAYDACITHVDEFTPQQRTTLHLKIGDRPAADAATAVGASATARPEAVPKPTREDYARISD